MAEVKWVKITTDMFDNRKIKHLRKLPDGNNIVLIWIMLLTMAGRCNANGMIFLTETIPYTPKMLADELDFEENTVRLALEALERMNMILTEEGHYAITNWEEYQNIEGMERIKEQTRKRVAKHRENKRIEACNVTCNVTVTPSNAIEEERRIKNKEKENSIYLSCEKKANFDREEAKLHLLEGGLGQGVVFISDEQISDLLDKLSLEEFDHYVSVVADCVLKGKRYKKTHYQAILDMATADRKIQFS